MSPKSEKLYLEMVFFLYFDIVSLLRACIYLLKFNGASRVGQDSCRTGNARQPTEALKIHFPSSISLNGTGVIIIDRQLSSPSTAVNRLGSQLKDSKRGQVIFSLATTSSYWSGYDIYWGIYPVSQNSLIFLNECVFAKRLGEKRAPDFEKNRPKRAWRKILLRWKDEWSLSRKRLACFFGAFLFPAQWPVQKSNNFCLNCVSSDSFNRLFSAMEEIEREKNVNHRY